MISDLPELDVIIINYNSGEALKKCLDHVMTGSEIKANVYVIDNQSSDDSLQFIEDSLQAIKLIKNSANKGYAMACNQGARLGRAPQIAFINPDCFIDQQQLAKISDVLAASQPAALIGCRVLNEDGSLQAATRRRLPTFWRVIWHMTGLSRWSIFKGININDSGEFDVVQTVEAVNGACVLVKRDAFEQLGGFDEGYPLHFEDLDFFARIRAEQRHIIYDSSVVVTHLKGHSIQDSEKIKNWKRIGLLRFFSKHRPRWEYWIAKFLLATK